ncbi:hypothetical protein F2Q65_14165 [Thiohalocapsa marina]|uniref:O-antigen ligase family protein n=1 Tax=Thiohalocapsa marina TaxID=424902 RepID=A0A5M8FGG1_9GAMM|nr:hypothetical protein [Thiohalocapsa marina]KAA6183948.1 hypothetical protein F2Q65_14165 [Thiohalocapsa marina]
MALLGFVGPTIQYVNQVFTGTNRWFLAALLMGQILLRSNIGIAFRSDVGRVLLLSMGWALLTYFWSGVPLLTLMKAFVYVLVAGAFFIGGQLWVRVTGVEHALDYLLPFVAVALLATLAGTTDPDGIVRMGELELYQGLTGNPNALGILMAMAAPILIWRLYRANTIWKRRAWMVLLGSVLISLLQSNSRASLLAFLATLTITLLAFPLRRRIMMASLALLSGLFVVVLTPGLIENLQHRYIYKGANPEVGALYTREAVWEESYSLAMEGGWFGGGYGVTIGDTSFGGGLSAVGYGREKGNSQLAIMEEMGLVGLFLYVIFLITLSRRLLKTFRRIHSRQEKVLFALVIGMLGGMLVQSVFEGWWVAPGSVEFAYFWALVGVGVGLGKVFDWRYRVARASRGSPPLAVAHQSGYRPMDTK